MAALMTVDYLEERAARGDRSKLVRVLRKVKATPPTTEDRLGS
jgi:hypothetical protein